MAVEDDTTSREHVYCKKKGICRIGPDNKVRGCTYLSRDNSVVVMDGEKKKVPGDRCLAGLDLLWIRPRKKLPKCHFVEEDLGQTVVWR
jgi:hypothetical protein